MGLIGIRTVKGEFAEHLATWIFLVGTPHNRPPSAIARLRLYTPDHTRQGRISNAAASQAVAHWLRMSTDGASVWLCSRIVLCWGGSIIPGLDLGALSSLHAG